MFKAVAIVSGASGKAVVLPFLVLMNVLNSKYVPRYAIVIQRSVETVCYRRIDKILKTQRVGTLNLLLAKVYNDHVLLEGTTGLLLKKAKNFKEGLSLLEKQDPKRIKERMNTLTEALNNYKRRCYEIA